MTNGKSPKMAIDQNLVEVDKVNDPSSSFETSPLRFEMEILLQEFRELRAEVLLRLNSGQQILNYTITLIIVSVTILQLEPQITKITGSEAGIRIILLAIITLFAALGLMYVEQDMFMAVIGRYIDHVLSPKLNKIVQVTNNEKRFVLGWEEFKINYTFKPPMVYVFSYLSSARYALPIIPPIFLLIYYFTIRPSNFISLGENILFIFSIFTLLTTMTAALIDGFMFLNADKGTMEDTVPTSSVFYILNRINTKGYYIFVLTILLGIFPMLVLSLNSNTLWFGSRVEFPLFSIPTIFIGDAILLSWFNQKAFLLFSQFHINYKIKAIIQRSTVVLIVSYFINSYTHSIWVSDSYLGFMDTEFGKLSLAGTWHLWFSIFQFAFVLLFLWISLDLYKQQNLDALIATRKTWFILVLFSSLTIFDFIVRHTIIFQNENIAIKLIEEIGSFSTLIISILVFVLYGVMINRLKSDLKGRSEK
jgi:hypothetical protein